MWQVLAYSALFGGLLCLGIVYLVLWTTTPESTTPPHPTVKPLSLRRPLWSLLLNAPLDGYVWLMEYLDTVRDGSAFMSHTNANDPHVIGVEHAPATTATTPATMIAIKQNTSNEDLLIAQVAVLAKLVHAKKIGQTDGIALVFGERASSTNQRYLLIRDLLHKELTRLAPPPSGPLFAPLTEAERKWCDEHGTIGLPRGGIPVKS